MNIYRLWSQMNAIFWEKVMKSTWRSNNSKIYKQNINDTIAASSLAAISICSITIISIRIVWIVSFSISSNFFPDDVTENAPDVTWNSNWPTGKSFYSFPGGLLENPAGPHGKPCWSGWNWMDLNRRIIYN